MIARPASLDLGTLAPGTSARGSFRLVVRGVSAVPLARIESSCSCLHIDAAPATVGVDEAAGFSVAFDPDDDPTFRGSLAVAITGRGPDDAELFRATVLVAVAEPSRGSQP